MKSSVYRMVGLVGIVAIFFAAIRFHGVETGGFDVPAFLLVLFAPYFILLIFQHRHLAVGSITKRMRELSQISNHQIALEVKSKAKLIGSDQKLFLSNMPKTINDSMARYASSLVQLKFTPAEVQELLGERAKNEDLFWEEVGQTIGFLAKMSPYFGMFATVMGMIQLLGHLDDFSKISGSMSMALQGTLFGIGSYVFLYSPLQNFFTSLRNRVQERNEMIQQVYLDLLSRKHPDYVGEKTSVQKEIDCVS